VINVPDRPRVHLVADTIGGDTFWDIAARGRAPGQVGMGDWQPESFPGDDSRPLEQLMLEQFNAPLVMTPWELREHLQFLFAHASPDPRLAIVEQSGVRFTASWHALWARFGDAPEGWPRFRALLDGFDAWMQAHAGPLRLANGMELLATWRAMILKAALNEQVAPCGRVPSPSVAERVPHGKSHAQTAFDRPVFIVSPPRSGSSLLFETLARGPGIFTIGGESHRMIEVELASGRLGTIERGYVSNRLDADDATGEIAEELRQRLHDAAFDREGRRPDGKLRLLEKTPKNALRIPFLARIFPDARFVYLYRDPREVLASMLEAWESGRFRTYPDLPGWTGVPWSLVLIPGWRALTGKALPEVVAAQWDVTTRVLLDDLEAIPPGQRIAVRYDRFIADPDAQIRSLCSRLDIAWDQTLGTDLPYARYTVSAPRADKWRAREREIQPCLALLEETRARAEHVARRDAAD
jgi:hypothetical protein